MASTPSDEMIRPTTRTTKHDYPREEVDAMLGFYGGKCIILGAAENVQWAHLLDVAFEPPNERLSMMLDCNLREDRHPRHAAEVRENIVPVNIDHHASMERIPSKSTLFLHEDVLARTLAYERGLQKWRMAELDAGMPDPGRPAYDEVFGGMRITQHRYHCSSTVHPFVRNGGDDKSQQFQVYYGKDCPGIDDPASLHNFPVIDTLLSIPFSLLHNLPRLCGIFPISSYQQRLIAMGFEILARWSWDFLPSSIREQWGKRLQNVTAGQQNDHPHVRPHPIHHPSRNDTTFNNVPILTSGAPTMWGKHAVERPLGPILLGMPTHFVWDTDEKLVIDGPPFSARAEGLLKEDLEHVEGDIITGIAGSPVTREARTGSKDWDDTDDVESVQDESEIYPLDITSWHQKVVNPEPEPPSLVRTPFERGVIGSMSVNDVLMVKGLIQPFVWIQFMDLQSFSRY